MSDWAQNRVVAKDPRAQSDVDPYELRRRFFVAWFEKNSGGLRRTALGDALLSFYRYSVQRSLRGRR